ncbi:CapA family protein [Limibacterium fermenti]|uniref:CapA family protein n=1 Tax=Limibacterium fermenti TaxID=3229863 RepID=UPI003A5D4A5B
MIVINFVGDISLNNRYEELYRKGISPFSKIEPIFSHSDYNIGNLECLCDDKGEVNQLKKPRLKTAPEVLQLLSPLRFNMLNLAHNHIYDARESGIECTCLKINELGADYIGYNSNRQIPSFIRYITVKGKLFAIISAVHPDTNPHIPEDVTLNLPSYSKEILLKYIAEAKSKSAFIILFLHWGGRVEEGFIPDWYQMQDAHNFVDKGADLVIGGHSHTVQPYEVYKGKYIFYSLGNFCFDDIENEGIMYPIGRFRKRRGIIVTIMVNEHNDSYTIKIIPVINRRCYIIPYAGYRLNMLIRNVYFYLIKNHRWLWRINFKLFRKLSPFYLYIFENTDSLSVKFSKFSMAKVLKHLRK